MSRILSKIPGSFIENPEAKSVKLEDFAAFHNLPEDLKKKQIESFIFANSVFPFYIPDEHHEINLSKLENGKGGEYWGNAAHFLLCNKAHGISLWKRFEAQIQSLDTTITCRPHISTNMVEHILQHINEQGHSNCFSSTHWLMLQLPFQPILLFQWLTNVVHYLWRIESNMADLYYVPFPEKFKPELLCLHKMLKTAHRNIGFLFDYLQHQTRCEPDIFVGNLKVFEEIVHGIFVFLKFWIIADCQNYLSDLLTVRKESLKSDEKVFELERGKMALQRRNFLFNLDFWRGSNSHLKIFGDSNEEIIRKRDTEDNLQDLYDDTNNILRKYFEPDDIKKVNIISMLEEHEFLTIPLKIKQHLEFACSTLDDEECGFIGQVLENNNIVEYRYTVSKFHAWIFKKFKVLPKIDPNSTEKPLYLLRVKNIIPLFGIQDRDKFSFQEQLNILKRNNQSNQKCSSRFEARIRTIVLDCIESHLRVQNFEEKKDEVLRDWHVVQYLLPCFVALYVKICESNKSKNKKLYAKFLDKLISTYEKNGIGIRKSSWSNVLQDINSFAPLRESYFNNNHEKLSNFFTKVSNLFKQRIMGGASNDASDHLQCCSLFQAFFEVIQKKTGDLDERDVVATEASAYWNWLMWDFFSRIYYIIEGPV